MSFPKYPEYKDSCVEWLGEVPAHWDIFPIKRDLELLTSGSRGWASHYADDGAAFIRIGNLTRDHIHLDLADLQRVNVPVGSEGERTKVKPGDVLFSITAYLGSVAVVSDDIETAYVSQHVALARLFKKRLLPGWVAYVTLSDVGKNYLSSQGYGGTKIQLSLEDVADLLVTAPPLCEQASITSFLDHETARIDALIEEQKRLIELLKEKRQAVISHAVTKGLDPDVPMKDSGVEWLGEVPAHWEVKPLRHLGECQNGINIGADAFGSGFPFVSYGDVYRNELLPTNPTGLVQSSVEDHERYSIKKGDVLFTRTSETVEEIGFSSTCFQDIPSATFAGFLIRFRPDEGVLSPSFSRYFFGSQRLREFFVKEMEIVTRASLGQDLLKRMSVPIAPIEEQARTAQHLDTITQKIDSLLDQARAAIKLLAERRSALISAAVTGKIDVRGWQAGQHAEQAEVLLAAEERAAYVYGKEPSDEV